MFKEMVVLPADSVTKPTLQAHGFACVRDPALGPSDYLLLLNRSNQALQWIDLRAKKQARRLKLQEEGPDGVGEVDYVYAHTPDSIYLVSPQAYQIILIDHNGRVRRRYQLMESRFKSDPQSPYPGFPMATFGSPMLQVGHYLYISCVLYLDRRNSGTYLAKAQEMMKLDLRNGKQEYGVSFPDTYRRDWSYPVQSLDHSHAYDPQSGRFAFSFQVNGGIYLYDTALRPVGGPGGSQSGRHRDFERMDNKLASSDQEVLSFQHYVSQVHYGALLHDPYRGVHYQLVHHPQGGPYPTPVRGKQGLSIYYSVLIFDQEFRKIGETYLDKHAAVARAFVGEAGLYIEGWLMEWQTSTRYTPNENEMCLMLFTLQKLADGQKP
jgi:hypothetical protein